MGKRKILMAKIANDQYRMVSFSKRRKGLFKKADELSALTGARTAVFVVSQAGRPYASASGPDVVDEFLSSTSDNEKAPIVSDGEDSSALSSPNDDDDITGVSLIGELLATEVGDCEGFDELLALSESLKEMRERVCLALDLQFVDSLLD